MVWKEGQAPIMHVANVHADVPVAEARILVDILWETRDTEPTTINYVTDCDFVVWVWKWSKRKIPIEGDRRCLWHITKLLLTALQTTHHKVNVWKTMSHVANPGLKIMDDLAKWVVQRKTVQGYKPQGVAAALDRESVLCVRDSEGDLLQWRYVGATYKVPEKEINRPPRYALPNMQVDIEIKTHNLVSFATKLARGVLYPHNWHTDRKNMAIRCPLCQQEIHINHSIMCPQGSIHNLQKAITKETIKQPRQNERRLKEYIQQHMKDAVLENFSRGKVMSLGLTVAAKKTWERTWKVLLPYMAANHKHYWEKVQPKTVKDWRESPPATWKVTEGKHNLKHGEQIYETLGKGLIDVKFHYMLTEEGTITESERRNLTEKILLNIKKN